MRGIAERRRRVAWRVQPELVPIPLWARDRAIRGLSDGPDHVWLRRGDAQSLERLDREAGGDPLVVETEYRCCKVCGRPLIGEEAAGRRRAEQGGHTAWMLPCGDQCIEASKDGRWRATQKCTEF